MTQIFQAEYRLVADLAKLAVPAVGLCHGVWMGFGVGLGGFLPIRVVSDKTVFAMPECSIGAPQTLMASLPPCIDLLLCPAVHCSLVDGNRQSWLGGATSHSG